MYHGPCPPTRAEPSVDRCPLYSPSSPELDLQIAVQTAVYPSREYITLVTNSRLAHQMTGRESSRDIRVADILLSVIGNSWITGVKAEPSVCAHDHKPSCNACRTVLHRVVPGTMLAGDAGSRDVRPRTTAGGVPGTHIPCQTHAPPVVQCWI